MFPLFYEIILLVVFLGVMVFGAHLAVESISNFSKIVGLSELSAGLVIVSLSTSLPEVMVSILSATSGNVGIAVGDVFGSNVTNIALIAGLLMLITPIKTIDGDISNKLSRELLIASVIPVLLLIVPADSRLVGLVLLVLFAYFTYSTLHSDWKYPKPPGVSGSKIRELIFFTIGIAVVIISARIIVDSASSIAIETGLRESIIGASIIALGTSLPELSVIMGSCVMNITLVLGIALVLSSITTDFRILTSMISFAILAPLLMFFFIRSAKISKWQGLLLLVLYLVFISVVYEIQFVIGGIV
ncbi:MAG: sodium:calcium antiporter [Thaumarchaeota archaeon]|nr:sodium:calcium antiporter [Nitrososphaerota archaeon]